MRGAHGERTLALVLDGVLCITLSFWQDWLVDAARRFRAIAEPDP